MLEIFLWLKINKVETRPILPESHGVKNALLNPAGWNARYAEKFSKLTQSLTGIWKTFMETRKEPILDPTPDTA